MTFKVCQENYASENKQGYLYFEDKKLLEYITHCTCDCEAYQKEDGPSR
jgi:hypothetical protein